MFTQHIKLVILLVSTIISNKVAVIKQKNHDMIVKLHHQLAQSIIRMKMTIGKLCS